MKGHWKSSLPNKQIPKRRSSHMPAPSFALFCWCGHFLCCCNKMPWIQHIKTIPTYLFFSCTGLKSSGLSWVLCLGSHKAWIRASAGVGSYLEAAEEELLPSSFRLFSSVQLLSHVQLLATPWTAACQAPLSITNSQSPPKPMSIESVMPSIHLILCHPLLLLPSNFPSIRVFSNESVLRIRWPKYWSFNFSISPSNEHPGLISLNSIPSQGSPVKPVTAHWILTTSPTSPLPAALLFFFLLVGG